MNWRLEVEEKFGKCCNSCEYWYNITAEEPCRNCSGGLHEDCEFSNWKSCRAEAGKELEVTK